MSPAIDPILDGPVAAALAAIDGAARARSSWSATRSARGSSRCTPGARAYRDLVGITHQRLAALADEAYLLVAGLPITLKGGRGRDGRTASDDAEATPPSRPWRVRSDRSTPTRWPPPRPASTD